MAETDPQDFRNDTQPEVAAPGLGDNKIITKDERTPAEKAKDTREKKKADKEKQEEDQKIITQAVKRFKRATEAESDNRAKALEDLKFKAGDQWPADLRAQRNTDKRPCITINDMPTFCHQIENDIRQNRPGINISPSGLQANKESAEVYAGMIRAIERNSAAEIAYDTAVTSAIDIGFGYFRVMTEFEKDNSFDQIITVKRIRNAFTVLLDPDRQEPDGCDARWGFISELMTRGEFKDKYPDAQEVAWNERSIGQEQKYWVTKDQIRVAEYFSITHEYRTLVMLSNNFAGFEDELDDTVKAQIASGELTEDKRREVEVQKVMWYRLTSYEVLESQEWLGKYIPIIEVLGDEIDVEGRVSRFGIIRNAKDPARLKNYWTTMKAEFIALQPKAPTIGPEGSFDGHENQWKVANIKQMPYLEYVPVILENGQVAPPPTRQPPLQVPQGYVEAEAGAAQDKMRTTGIRFDASLQERTYDESGKALHEIRRNTDIGSFHYADNLARSLRHAGRVYIDLIQKMAVKQRIFTILNEDGSDSVIKIDPTMSKAVGKVQQQDQTQPPMKVFNPKIGNYEVTVTIGPSFATRRIEAQEQITKLMSSLAQVSPQAAAALAPLIAKYSDFPGSTEAYKALLSTLPPQMQQAEIQNLPPQAQAMIAALQKQLQTNAVEKQKMLKDLSDQTADRMLIKDRTDKDFEAKLLKIGADMEKHNLSVQNSIKSEVQGFLDEMRHVQQIQQTQQQAQETQQPKPNQGAPS